MSKKEPNNEPKPTKEEEKILLIPSKEHKQFLNDFFTKWVNENFEENFTQTRLICHTCQEKITDINFIVLPNPHQTPTEPPFLYYHSKGDCYPRKEKIKEARTQWLSRLTTPLQKSLCPKKDCWNRKYDKTKCDTCQYNYPDNYLSITKGGKTNGKNPNQH